MKRWQAALTMSCELASYASYLAALRLARLRCERPEEGPNIAWWLRLQGTRDIVSGLVVLALVMWGSPYLLGIVLLIEAVVPAGDMSLVLAAKGSAARAFGIHALTAVLMVVAAVLLLTGVA